MTISGAQARARVARAIWAYSGLTNDKLASAAGIQKDRLRAILARTNPKEATLDELSKLAQAVTDIPQTFALEGFEPMRDGRTSERLAALEGTVKAAEADRAQMREALQTVLATLSRQARDRGLADVAQTLERTRRMLASGHPPRAA